jgi:hypothetical protein
VLSHKTIDLPLMKPHAVLLAQQPQCIARRAAAHQGEVHRSTGREDRNKVTRDQGLRPKGFRSRSVARCSSHSIKNN